MADLEAAVVSWRTSFFANSVADAMYAAMNGCGTDEAIWLVEGSFLIQPIC